MPKIDSLTSKHLNGVRSMPFKCLLNYAATQIEQHLFGFVFRTKDGDGLKAAIGHLRSL